jgi:nucleotide-binding universal stress UspA family protein
VNAPLASFPGRPGGPLGGRAGRIVLGVGTSLPGLAALRYAVEQARSTGKSLHAVRVWIAPNWQDRAGQYWRRRVADEAVDTMSAAFAAAIGGPPTDLLLEQCVVEGFAGDALVRYADRPDDLLVVGGQPRRRVLSHAYGPVSGYCLRRSRCPVVVVPAAPLIAGVPVRRLVREMARDLRRLG